MKTKTFILKNTSVKKEIGKFLYKKQCHKYQSIRKYYHTTKMLENLHFALPTIFINNVNKPTFINNVVILHL